MPDAHSNPTAPAFQPPWWLRGAHGQTVGGALLPPPRFALAGSESLAVDVEPGEQLLLERTPASGQVRGRLLLLHGLGGSSASRHLIHTLAVARERGWEVIRVNARGAGEGVTLSRRLAHAGRWSDLAAIVAAAPFSAAAWETPLCAIGFSLGGAILLRYLAETADASHLQAAVTVSPPTDLAWSLQALERRRNALYHQFYAAALRRALARKATLYRDTYAPPHPWRHRSVRAMDEDYVAADAGFDSAEAYYAGCSAAPLLHRIRTPTVVLSAADDPFIPAAMLRRDVPGNDWLALEMTARGGHVGYLQRHGPRLSFWAAARVLDALDALLARRSGRLLGRP